MLDNANNRQVFLVMRQAYDGVRGSKSSSQDFSLTLPIRLYTVY